MPSTLHDWLALPMVGLAVAIVLTVIGARLTTNSANGLMIVAWVLATVSILVLPFVAKLDVIPRILWTVLFASLTGLVLYQLRWTDPVITVSSQTEPQAASPVDTDSSTPKLESLLPMPSLLSLFMTDFTGKGSNGSLIVQANGFADLSFTDNTNLHILYNVNEDYISRSKFISFYIQSSPHTYDAIEFLSTGYKQYLELPFGAEIGSAYSPSTTTSRELTFTGRIFIYHEDTLTLSQLGKLSDVYEKNGINPEFRTTSYALAVWDTMRSGKATPPPKYEIRDGIPQQVGSQTIK